MKNIAKFNVAISELIDVPNPDDAQHPFATMAKFIFTDDKPNGNHQGIRLSEFPNVSKSAIGMPIKMNFTGVGVANHGGSIPIGHIKAMNTIAGEDTNQLVAEAMLWSEEFPDEIAYLKQAYAAKKAPNLSYEIDYKDSDTEDGTQWIKGTTTLAATFVRDPAYGSRTHLLALSSLDEKERNVEILALAEQIKEEGKTPIIEGGNLMEKEQYDKEIEKLHIAEAATRTQLDELTAKLAESDTKYAEKEAENLALTNELGTLRAAAMIDSRVRQYVEAGFTMEADAEKAEKRKSLFSSLDEDQWTDYLADLQAVKASAPVAGAAFASMMNRNNMPKIEVAEGDKTSLKDAMRQLARPHSV